MGKNKNYRDNDHYSPFTYAKDKWDDNDDETITVKIDPAKKGVQDDQQQLRLEGKIYVLTANVSYEKLVLWWTEMEGKIFNRSGLSWADKLSVLTRASSGEMKQIITNAINQTGADVDQHKWENKIAKATMKTLAEDRLTDEQIASGEGKARITAFCNGKKVELLPKPDGSGNIWTSPTKCTANKVAYRTVVMQEIYWRLCMRNFGRDHAGRQAYVHAKRHLANMKIYHKRGGLKEYNTWFKQLDSYLEYCPWQAGNVQGKHPTRLDEDRKMKILFGHLSSVHLSKLIDRDWDVLEHDYDESISQLLTIEAGIEELSCLRADVDCLLQNNNIELASGAGRKRIRNDAHGGGNLTKRSRTHQQEGGGKNKGKTKCNNCGRYHLGECWRPRNGQEQQKGGGGNNYKKSGLTKAKYEQVAMIIENDKNKDQDRDYDTSSSGGAAWRRGLTDIESMYILKETGHLNDDSDDKINIPKQEMKRVKKEAKAATRRLKQLK